jgi:hypothetical protein
LHIDPQKQRVLRSTRRQKSEVDKERQSADAFIAKEILGLAILSFTQLCCLQDVRKSKLTSTWNSTAVIAVQQQSSVGQNHRQKALAEYNM